jgi:hypothetical protein
MTTSMTPNEAEGSSSVEPDWGRTRQKSAKELEAEWQARETVNSKRTPDEVASEWKAWSTPKYKHDRCYRCHKPVTTKWLEEDFVFLCQECTPTEIENDTVETNTETRRERNDEEEWGRISVPCPTKR